MRTSGAVPVIMQARDAAVRAAEAVVSIKRRRIAAEGTLAAGRARPMALEQDGGSENVVSAATDRFPAPARDAARNRSHG